MKKLIVILAFFLLVSCNQLKIWDDISISNTWVKVDDISISTWNVVIWDDISISTWNVVIWDDVNVSETWTVVTVSDWENEEKDIIIVEEWSSGDLDWKTEEEVVEEMGDYVNDLFNMIEEDVK
jgi:hypothetical protein